MAQFAAASFTGAAFTELSAVDGNWSKQTGYTGDIITGATGAYVIRNNNVVEAVYQHSGTPASANYTVSADIAVLNANGANPRAGVCGRMQAAAQTMYQAIWSEATGNIRLFKIVAGTQTQLGSSYTFTLTTTPVSLRLRMDGSSISVELDGSTIIGPVTDTDITTAGKAGIYLFDNRETGVSDATSLDNFSGDDIGGGDVTAPVLTSPTGTATGSTTATVGATTDEGNGTMYAFVSTSATPPSAADLKAGTGAVWSGSQAISTTGAKTFNATGLTASTGYYAHLIHTDAAANDSNIVTSAQFTTTAANSAPSWSGTPSAMSTKRGQALTPQDITSLVSDADLDTLSYSITGAPTGVTINSSTGVISGTPTAAPGVYACTVEADDGIASPVSSSSFNITVQQATLALNAAGYEIADGNTPATAAIDALVAWEIEVINDALPPVSVYHSDSVTTSAAGRLADISDDDLIYGTTYTVLGRRVSDGEWFAFTITAT